MSDTSFDNFLADMFIRSFECGDWISEELGKLGTQVELDLIATTKSSRGAYKNIYQAMVNSLKSNVAISSPAGILSPEIINYHKRFGWVLESIHAKGIRNENKIFLGKISLLENTKVTMGRRTYISGPSIIRGGETLTIGSFCSLGESLYVNTSLDSHPMTHAAMVNMAGNRRLVEDGLDMPISYSELQGQKSGVIIGNDVWTGRRVRISCGIIIGDGCVIAENSLVRNDCEPFGIYGGTPARLIRYRFEEDIREQLLNICWWDWPLKKIQQNATFFNTQLTSFRDPIETLIV